MLTLCWICGCERWLRNFPSNIHRKFFSELNWDFRGRLQAQTDHSGDRNFLRSRAVVASLSELSGTWGSASVTTYKFVQHITSWPVPTEVNTLPFRRVGAHFGAAVAVVSSSAVPILQNGLCTRRDRPLIYKAYIRYRGVYRVYLRCIAVPI